ncbi:MAG: hypothetical protein CR988_08130 [Treponema sp.]|nr:MAG: hypothetical protein CR988_08130 [Treponema sp.]
MATLKEITTIALRAGEIMSESGSETYRVEDTMRRFSRALGSEDSAAYAIPTGLFLSCEKNTHKDVNDIQVVTRMERLSKRSTNLGKIAAVNSLSRKVAMQSDEVDIEEVETELERIRNCPDHKALPTIIATAITAFVFTLMFSGDFKDACIAFCVAFLMRSILFLVSLIRLGSFMFAIIGSTVISFSTGILINMGVGMSFDIINIAALMTLVPGVPIVVAIRDTIAGDYISGGARATEAFVIALSLSLGAAAGLLLFPASRDYNTSMALIDNPIVSFFQAAVISACFAYIFQVKRLSRIFWTAVAGGFGWMLFIILNNIGFSSMSAFVLGAFCVGLLAEIFAFVLKDPATVFVIPALISFVPGGGVYATMYNIILQKQNTAISAFLQTLSIAGAIALGVAFASGFARFLSGVIIKAKKNRRV